MSKENPRFSRTALGIVLLAAGVFVLADVTLVARLSIVAIGGAAIVAGVFEIVHGFWTRERSGLIGRILLGILYAGFGAALMSRPDFGSLFLLYSLGLVLVASGIVRAVMAVRQRGSFWWLLASGLFGIAAGLVILTGWPISGIRVIATLLGLDLVTHGIAWLAITWRRNEAVA